MRRSGSNSDGLAVAVVILAASAACWAGSNYVVPTTTLAAQTANNTSAANTFASQTNGNLGAGNVSKVDIHSLLYSGTDTKIYAHYLLWFGESSHMNVGYSSTNPAEITSQINDMISRGITGVIIDWYGPNNAIDQATQLVMAAAETHPGFTFAIMIDAGAIEWDSCTGCTPQEALISQLQYIEQTYFTSPAYMTLQGQPVVTNFNIDIVYTVDWSAVNSALSTQPAFLFQNNSGFTHTLSDGSYAWVMPTTTDYGMSYLSSFYDDGMTFANEQTVGASYKGFNDTLASWGSNRIMGQQCGQTWLQTFSEINGLYSEGKPLPDLQLVTWNDYEEGTEIESGIDNCLALAAAVAGNGALQWSVSGNENTVDHYTVYISTDGQNLMPLSDAVAGTRALNLCSFSIPSGSYKLFVQAIGRPSLANQMSGAVSYTAACGAIGPETGTATLAASPTSVTMPAGQSASFTITAAPQGGAFNNAITLSCAGLPSTLSCSFSPVTITPGSGTASSVVTISAAVTGMNLPQRRPATVLYASLLLPFGLAGLVFMGSGRSGRCVQRIALCGILAIGLGTVSCGGNMPSSQGTSNPPIAAASYSITINGTSSAAQISTTVSVTVQ
jgi:hypothetical protein